MPIQISCVVLSYNGGDSLIRTLESCKLQTYPYKDLVIADDASTDNGYTVSVIEKWLTNNNKFFIDVLFIKNECNMGIVKNLRNASIHAQGDILFPLGQGDTAYGPDTFVNIAKKINTYPEGVPLPIIWFGYFQAFSLTPSWHIVNHLLSQPFHFQMMQEKPKKALSWLAYVNYIGAPSMIYNKKYFSQEIFPLPESIRDVEDYSMLIWLMSQQSNNKIFDILPFFLKWYELGVGISSNNSYHMKKRFINSMLNINDWVINTLNTDKHINYLFMQKQIYMQQKSRLRRLIHCPFFILKTRYLNLYFKICYIFYSKKYFKNIMATSKSFTKSLFSTK